MNKLGLHDLDLKSTRVLMRVDFNVPIQKGVVGDETRIAAALPTINKVLESGASVVLMSHLGRPKGEVNPEYSLAPVVPVLAALLMKTRQSRRWILKAGRIASISTPWRRYG